MERTLPFKQLSLYARGFLSPRTIKPFSYAGNNCRPSVELFRLFSSKVDSSMERLRSLPETNSTDQTQKEESSADLEDVSNEELKRRIEKYFEGDEEAIPSIFEAILKRKLAGKHDESDDELIEEFRHKSSDVSDEEFDSE